MDSMIRHSGQSTGGRGGRATPLLLASVLICAMLAPCASSLGLPTDSLEYEVKAAMLYNFIRFVEWPASTWKDSRAPLIVGVVGADPFGHVLDQMMQDKNYSGRSIQIRRFRSLAETETCQLLFVSKSEKKRLAEILRFAQTGNVLTVSDIDDFVQAGGSIGFVLADNRIRFEINSAMAAKSGLTVSSKLLRLATSNGRRGGNSQ